MRPTDFPIAVLWRVNTLLRRACERAANKKERERKKKGEKREKEKGAHAIVTLNRRDQERLSATRGREGGAERDGRTDKLGERGTKVVTDSTIKIPQPILAALRFRRHAGVNARFYRAARFLIRDFEQSRPICSSDRLRACTIEIARTRHASEDYRSRPPIVGFRLRYRHRTRLISRAMSPG